MGLSNRAQGFGKMQIRGKVMRSRGGDKPDDSFSYESQFVDQLCSALPDHLSCRANAWQVAREVSVGRCIADVVVLLPHGSDWHQPLELLTTYESVILSSLRLGGPTRIDLLENRCGIAHGGLRSGALDRLVAWEMVTLGKGGRISLRVEKWPVTVIAIEAKLMRWRDALTQAVAYRKFADESYVAIPDMYAAPATKASSQFRENGVGLLVVSGNSVLVSIDPAASHAQDWRREFVVSRLTANGHKTHRGNNQCPVIS